MKKYTFLLLFLALVLASLACNLPYQNQEDDISALLEPAEGFRVENRILGSESVELSVPESYYVSDSINELSSLLGSMGLSGSEAGVDLTGIVNNAQEDVLVWGYDAGSLGDIPTSFVVAKNEDYAAMPLGLISTFAGTLLGDDVEILEELRLTIAGRDTLRWITVVREGGIELTQVVYIFKDSGVLYLVGFNADRQEVYAQLSNYDAIVASLRIEDLE